MSIVNRVVGVFLAGGLLVAPSLAIAQDFPNKPLRIFTSDPGGGTDFLSRILAQGISGPLGQPVIVENRGGNVLITANTVVKSPPDGHTLLVWAQGVWLAQYLEKSPTYDPVRDLAPISWAVVQPNVLVVHPSLPAKSAKDLIAIAKARPGELNYAAAGSGGTTHLAAELFKSLARVNVTRVNYRSTGTSITGVISGEAQLMFSTATAAMPHIKSKRLTALAVTTAKPSALVPGLRPLAEAVPGYEAVVMTGVFAPAKTPAAVISRLHQEVVRVLTSADIKAKLFNAGSEVVANSPEEFAAVIKSDMAVMGKVIKEAGIRSE